MVVVIDVSFIVNCGEIFVIMGLFGLGKFIIICMFNGLYDVSFGIVMVNGDLIIGVLLLWFCEICCDCILMVFQYFVLLLYCIVVVNVVYLFEFKGVVKVECLVKVEEIFVLVGFEGQGEKFLFEFFGGMQQCVGIVCVFVVDSDILLMDEVFSVFDLLIC